MEFITDRTERCSKCGGRQVLTIKNEEVVDKSLVQIDADTYVCKDTDECNMNLLNEGCEIEDDFVLEMLEKAGADTSSLKE